MLLLSLLGRLTFHSSASAPRCLFRERACPTAAVVQQNSTLQSLAAIANARMRELSAYPLRSFPPRVVPVPYTVARVAGGAAQYQTCELTTRGPSYLVRLLRKRWRS